VTQGMQFSENHKFVIGLLLLVACFCFYLAYHFTKIIFLSPVSIAFFAAGIYLIQSKFKFLKQYRQLLTFSVVIALILWLFSAGGWEDSIYQSLGKSPYVVEILGIEAKMTTLTLNAFGIHATQNSHYIIFPSDSKTQAIDIGAGCAGLSSLVVFFGAFGLMLIDFNKKVSRKMMAAFFLIGMTSILLVNLLRFVLLTYIAYAFGNNALEISHEYLGFLNFMVVIVLFWILSMKLISNSKHTKNLTIN
jgi:exosortase/archaeosortase family protein